MQRCVLSANSLDVVGLIAGSLRVREQAESRLCINGTLPDRSEVVKDFTPECGGKTPRGAPRGVFPTHEGVKPLLQSKREE